MRVLLTAAVQIRTPSSAVSVQIILDMRLHVCGNEFIRGLQRLRHGHIQPKRWKQTAAENKPCHGLSYVSVGGQQPLIGLTLGQFFDESVKKYGDLEGLVVKHQGIRRTYAQLQSEVDNLAMGFMEGGLEKGDRIGIWGTNSHEWYLTHVAAAKAGYILVNINPACEGPEILYALNKVGMRGLVIGEEFKGRNHYDILSSVIPTLPYSEPGKVKAQEAPALSKVISISKKSLKGAFTFDEVLSNGSRRGDKKTLSEIGSSVQFDDVFNIQFTSGTTGKPKGVMLTHHNLVNNSYVVSKRLEYSTKDRLCLGVPFFHCYGLVGGVLAGIHSGATCVVPSPIFDARRMVEVTEEEKCTAIYGTPTMHVDMTNLEGIDTSSMRLAITAGSSCPEELVKKMMKVYGAKVVSFYGLTETSPVFFQSLPEDSLEQRIFTVGFPQEHTEVKVVGKDGRIVPLGSEGEICTRGYMTMLGYWNDPEKTKEVLQDDGWFHTGDTFVMEESGHGRVVGRLKDMIIRGGENIYPREIEEFLHLHPKILEAHVCGLPDERLGEVVCAWVRVKDGETVTEEELQSYAKGKISRFKIPKHIFIRNEFPTTASGKIQKFLMREESLRILGSEKKN